ncbi:MAG: Fic family protein [Actinobacteria bacterium]|nr:Fic family protein [Actinomycetota bacterium]
MSPYIAPPPEGSPAPILEGLDEGAYPAFVAAMEVTPRGKYRHWDNLRQLKPPSGLTSEQWWAAVKFARRSLFRQLPLKDEGGQRFVFTMPDGALEALHFIDQHASGEIAMSEVVTADHAAKNRYLVNSFIEEAIRSSQLEGATTSRVVAKEMIRSGRPPKDRSEQMILNNFRALQFMHEEIGEELTPSLVLELQRILTEETLDNPDAAGRLQTPDDERVGVFDARDGSLVHKPPPADQLPDRLSALCAFANGEDAVDGFLHPVVRAILIHFWLAYDHPFEDGNGRTARALFYWSMKTQGYWLAEYLSISRILRQAPSKYSNSFVYTETDERDTTYFILYQLDVFRRAINELHEYLQRKILEVKGFESIIKGSDNFNYRQLALLRNAIREPHQRYTFRSHSLSHNVTRQTARTDLLALVKAGLLSRKKVGRQFVFEPTEGLPDRLGILS